MFNTIEEAIEDIKQGKAVIVIDDESAESNEKFYHNPEAEYHKISIEDYYNPISI